jgi:hypothetical protein
MKELNLRLGSVVLLAGYDDFTAGGSRDRV